MGEEMDAETKVLALRRAVGDALEALDDLMKESECVPSVAWSERWRVKLNMARLCGEIDE